MATGSGTITLPSGGSTLTTWLKAYAGSFGTELALTDADYAAIVDYTLEILNLTAEELTKDVKAVSKSCFWLRVMSLTTGVKDTFDRAKEMYGISCDAASVYVPDIGILAKSLTFYDPYVTTLIEDELDV
jgi:hypothetical protein